MRLLRQAGRVWPPIWTTSHSQVRWPFTVFCFWKQVCQLQSPQSSHFCPQASLLPSHLDFHWMISWRGWIARNTGATWAPWPPLLAMRLWFGLCSRIPSKFPQAWWAFFFFLGSLQMLFKVLHAAYCGSVLSPDQHVQHKTAHLQHHVITYDGQCLQKHPAKPSSHNPGCQLHL